MGVKDCARYVSMAEADFLLTPCLDISSAIEEPSVVFAGSIDLVLVRYSTSH